MRKLILIIPFLCIGLYVGGYLLLRFNNVLVLNDTVPLIIRVNLSHSFYDRYPHMVEFATQMYSPFISLENGFFRD